MRQELRTMCNIIVGLNETEKKQVMMVLSSSMLRDRDADSAFEVCEESKEGISIKHSNKLWSTLRTLTDNNLNT